MPTSTLTSTSNEGSVKFDERGLLSEYFADGTTQRIQPFIGDGGEARIAVNGDSSIWFFTDQGVSRIFNGRITHFTDERSALAAAFPWTGTQTLWLVAPDGTLWTIAGGKLVGYNGETWSNIPLDGIMADTVEHVVAGPDGMLAITSASGLSVYTPEKGWYAPPLPEEAPRDRWFGNELLAAADGSLWIGLDFQGSGGLLHYVPDLQTWTVFDEKNSDLSQMGIKGLTLDAGGDIWIANDTRGIVAVQRAKAGVWEYLTRQSPFPEVYGFGRVYFGAHDELWLPTIGRCGENGDPCWQGLAQYAAGKWKRYTTADGLVSEHVFALAVDPDGVPWLVTDAGLQKFKP
ncbi:MAG TPA: hypothetical protein VLG46_08680 [Anaerolineae bacterium]|nr:hypothetical protein [Anaerolineae bacterium]